MRFVWMIAALLTTTPGAAQPALSPHVGETFWRVVDREAIEWKVAGESRLPHEDHIEMAGRRVAGIISYAVDADGRVSVQRDIIYPQMRIFPTTESPEFFRYRAYLRANYGDDALPTLLVDRQRLAFAPLLTVRIDGLLHFVHQPEQGVQLERRFFPSMQERLFVEEWTVRNVGENARQVQLLPQSRERTLHGPQGEYQLVTSNGGPTGVLELAPGAAATWSVAFSAQLNDEPRLASASSEVRAERGAYVQAVAQRLVLRSPDPAIDTLFRFAKIRAAESLFESRMGLVHSPGGGNYYVGVWANDQAEYSGPFFPYLGYAPANEAALNAYRMFLEHIPPNGRAIWSSFEMEGELPCCGKDRGDAAMLAAGASRFALSGGDPAIARELWPLVQWALEFCRSRLNADGVVQSESDEMEGRIGTGSANLATSCLYLDALHTSANLVRALGLDPALAEDYKQRADALTGAIDRYFGATIAGLETYRYYREHDALRHWISLPLVVGLRGRETGTLAALFDRMWTPHGVRVEWRPDGESPDLFWDRGTLYALRGAFVAGADDLGLARLQAYTRTRLLGFHVPYPIEAWPENNMRHLSAESALYSRIITEGLLGMSAVGFDRVRLVPRLPTAWAEEGYSLSGIALGGRPFDVSVRGAAPDRIEVRVTRNGEQLLQQTIARGESIEVAVPR